MISNIAQLPPWFGGIFETILQTFGADDWSSLREQSPDDQLKTALQMVIKGAIYGQVVVTPCH
ncbi:hypothetical protein TIFTF001_044752 [Ficus carica]|uniref:Uncharacterized protein n=1 Tax=Ficus carica TaxID=3494 RepID=A0AA87ZFT4_FICCA|nr:hypothetical protein TIFTF001_044752 [Ficus carica]